MEERELWEAEWELRRFLKARLLGIAAVERAQWRQRLWLTKIRLADANCKFFLLKANGRRRKNFISKLASPSGEVSDHGDKAKLIFDHFNSLLGTAATPTLRMNWEALGIPSFNLQHLDSPFSTDEIKKAVFDLHDEKAPGLDGFIGGFFKRFWPLISDDICNALKQFHQLRGDQWKLLNSALIVLLPKRVDATRVGDYRPVSLMHSVAKLVCKVLANRLGPELHRLISHSQSAFIRGRCIQDNFLYVQNVIKDAHKRKKPLLFLKLDIAKAFDSVSWPY